MEAWGSEAQTAEYAVNRRGSPVVQELRLHAAYAGHPGLALVRELRTHLLYSAVEKKSAKQITNKVILHSAGKYSCCFVATANGA